MGLAMIKKKKEQTVIKDIKKDKSEQVYITLDYLIFTQDREIIFVQ